MPLGNTVPLSVAGPRALFWQMEYGTSDGMLPPWQKTVASVMLALFLFLALSCLLNLLALMRPAAML